jgi:hypothetical protein
VILNFTAMNQDFKKKKIHEQEESIEHLQKILLSVRDVCYCKSVELALLGSSDA